MNLPVPCCVDSLTGKTPRQRERILSSTARQIGRDHTG